jgi:hypothetical protein
MTDVNAVGVAQALWATQNDDYATAVPDPLSDLTVQQDIV